MQVLSTKNQNLATLPATCTTQTLRTLNTQLEQVGCSDPRRRFMLFATIASIFQFIIVPLQDLDSYR